MSDNTADEGSESDPMKTVADALEKAVQTAANSAADAKTTLENSLPAAGQFLSRLVYTTCYSLSYGVVFPTLWVARSIPPDNAVVNGLAEGAKAAIEAVDQLKKPQLSPPMVESTPTESS
jgi:hypothetical protein